MEAYFELTYRSEYFNAYWLITAILMFIAINVYIDFNKRKVFTNLGLISHGSKNKPTWLDWFIVYTFNAMISSMFVFGLPLFIPIGIGLFIVYTLTRGISKLIGMYFKKEEEY